MMAWERPGVGLSNYAIPAIRRAIADERDDV
eukprot:CAMPEP_0117570722 /NCGR_PEP_ID=MMETSP0784-20121206/59353_1 /TAXON_ID=39447 /ORGANISM="" /LENGTH=30 /DNA_ID= /DNA_START= /DNA_END= /DNA_ORIENTATION=